MDAHTCVASTVVRTCSHAQHPFLAIVYVNSLVHVSLVTSLIVNTNTLTGQDRFDDYTGRTLPGVYLLEPSEDTFNISLRRRGELHLDVTRIQFPRMRHFYACDVALANGVDQFYDGFQGMSLRFTLDTCSFSGGTD